MSKRTASGRIYVYSAPGYNTEWSRTVGSTTIKGKGKLKVGYTDRSQRRRLHHRRLSTTYGLAQLVLSSLH